MSYLPLFSITIIIRYWKEVYWLGCWKYWKLFDLRFTVTKNMSLNDIYDDIKYLFKISENEQITLKDYKNQTIYRLEDIRDKELYFVCLGN